MMNLFQQNIGKVLKFRVGLMILKPSNNQFKLSGSVLHVDFSHGKTKIQPNTLRATKV